MSHRPLLALETRASVALTPGIQLALKLLQIPAIELNELITQELLANPLLELVEEETAETAAEQERTEPAPEAEEEPPRPEWADLAEPEPFPAEREAWDEEPDPAMNLAGESSLGEFLLSQLRLLRVNRSEMSAAEYLIGCLDDRGYLASTPEEAARELALAPRVLRRALVLVQSLEPAGVGARDLRECLCLQLRWRGLKGSLAWRICREQFACLAMRRYGEIARRLAVAPAEVHAALAQIRRLRPHPGRLVSREQTRYIYPDLIIERVGRGYEVYTCERALPRLRISRFSRELIASPGAEAEARRFALSGLRSARWLIRALDRRRSTMLRVMRCILDEQREFFDGGVAFLKPMTLRVVAGRLGLHESTIARVTRMKYVQTPRGIFPLRFFFSNRVCTRTGEAASGRAVRERIRRMIAEEDRECPLSDEGVVAALEKEGIHIARRTVTKYRDSLRIERSQLRRRAPGVARETSSAGVC